MAMQAMFTPRSCDRFRRNSPPFGFRITTMIFRNQLILIPFILLCDTHQYSAPTAGGRTNILVSCLLYVFLPPLDCFSFWFYPPLPVPGVTRAIA